MLRTGGWLTLLALLPLIAACSNEPSSMSIDVPDAAVSIPDAAIEDTGPALTYYRDVKPILDAKCLGCHRPGGIGPIDLSDPDVATQLAPLLRAEVEAGRMPPWPPGQECNRYLHDRSLSSV